MGHTESPIKGGNDNTTLLGSLKGGNSSDSDDATILLSMPSPDTTMSYGEDIHSVTSMLSPISLKQNCIQVLSENTAALRPPSLYHLCVDFMAWNHDVYYNSSLVLPRSMNMATKVIELRNFTPILVETDVDIGHSTQITVYENMKVDREVHKYWLHQAQTRKYSVSLPILSAEYIRLWCDPRSLDRWKEIDPYSDLEDIGDKTEDSEKPLSPSISPTVKYKLRVRKPTRQCSTRPLRSASVNIVYYNDSDNELPVKKRVSSKCIPSGGPSQSCIKSQKSRATVPETTHPIPIKQKQKAETVSRPQPDSSDSDVPLSKIRDSLNKSRESDVTPVNHDENTPCKPRKK